MENSRPVTFAFVVAAVAAGLFVRSATVAIMTAQSVEDPMLAGVAPASGVAALVVGAVTLLVLLRHEKAKAFCDSVVTELKKVAWPSREETTNNTGIVVVATVLFGGLLSVYDYVWAQIAEVVLYSAG